MIVFVTPKIINEAAMTDREKQSSMRKQSSRVPKLNRQDLKRIPENANNMELKWFLTQLPLRDY